MRPHSPVHLAMRHFNLHKVNMKPNPISVELMWITHRQCNATTVVSFCFNFVVVYSMMWGKFQPHTQAPVFWVPENYKFLLPCYWILVTTELYLQSDKLTLVNILLRKHYQSVSKSVRLIPTNICIGTCRPGHQMQRSEVLPGYPSSSAGTYEHLIDKIDR